VKLPDKPAGNWAKEMATPSEEKKKNGAMKVLHRGLDMRLCDITKEKEWR
jgi:hypothetical protein